jgi:ComF family protein
MKKLLEELKYKKVKKILPFLQSLIVKFGPKYQDIDYIIPVPIHPIRFQERGFNQSLELIKPYSGLSNIPIRTDIIYHKSNTRKLYSLDPTERLNELKNAFAIWPEQQKDIYDKTILLFDDIITTGSTMKSIIAVLSEFKPKNILCLSLCRPAKKN